MQEDQLMEHLPLNFICATGGVMRGTDMTDDNLRSLKFALSFVRIIRLGIFNFFVWGFTENPTPSGTFPNSRHGVCFLLKDAIFQKTRI
jgi:hypothetical protein